MDSKKKVEAVLFSLGKEVSTSRLAELTELETEEVKVVMEELKKDYESRDHSLRILQRGDNFKLTVKDDFLPLVGKLVEGMDLDKALMETLAVIAWKYPVTQSEVIKLRNNKAYEHIKRLMELEFVEKERTGRTYKLKLTKKFFEYFDLPSDEAKEAFLKNVPSKVLEQAKRVDKESDEVGKLVELEKKEKGARIEIKGAIDQLKTARQEELRERQKIELSVREEAKGENELFEQGEMWAGELNKKNPPIQSLTTAKKKAVKKKTTKKKATKKKDDEEDDTLVEVDEEMAEQIGVAGLSEEQVAGGGAEGLEEEAESPASEPGQPEVSQVLR